MMFCPNSSNQMNPSNDGLIRMNGWSQVVPISMPWAASTPTTSTTVSNALINGYGLQGNVMKFTANTQPFNVTISSSITPITSSMVSMSVPNQVLSPDPCTSQTATRWELLNNISMGSHLSHQHLKRRNDSSDEEFEEELRTPVKQHISEDKVSAIFNRLQITNSEMIDINDKIECEEFDEQCDDSKNSIVLTTELQTAIKHKTITDRLIQSEFDKHSKAVVLWQPISLLYSSNPINSNSCEEDCDKNDSNSSLNQNNSSNLEIESFDFNDSDMELCL